MTMRTLRVTGQGQLRLRPDTTRLTLTLEGADKDYGETLRRSSEETKALRELISRHGFSESDLKTLSFSAEAEYEGCSEDGVYRQRFVGYRFRHAVKLDFPSDDERLGRLLYDLAHSSVKAEFRLSYTVADPESAKNALIEKAVADAGEKAKVLAAAAGVRLGKVQSVDYSLSRPDLETRPAERMLLAKSAAPASAGYDLNVTPDDIEISDVVTVIWEIE